MAVQKSQRSKSKITLRKNVTKIKYKNVTKIKYKNVTKIKYKNILI